MKLHRTLVKAVINTLQSIFEEGMYADKAVELALKQNTKWGSRDRRFIAETIYGMVRWWRLIEKSASVNENKTHDDYWKMIAVWLIMNDTELPGWVEFTGIDKNKILADYADAKLVRMYRESIPDWLDELGSNELGEDLWTNELHELNKEAQVVLRVNTLKTNIIQLQRLLSEKEIEVEIVGDYTDALVLRKRQNISQLNEYKDGLFEIQDASSQLIAPFLDLKEGMTVVDACAGAGGKSLHIAAMMKNNGKVISLDVEERKLIELKKRADRGGASIIQTNLITANTVNQYKNTADRLLLDAPCSGLGVLKRNPGAKWKLSLGFINEIKIIQQGILSSYSQMLKPGGVMVYATCSILPSENQQQVETFLSNNKSSFEFIEDRKVMPSDGFDGFYMAKIKRVK